MTAKPITFGPEDEAELDILSILTDIKKSEAEKKGALVEEVLNRYTIKTLEDTNEMLFYDSGVFKGGAEAKIIAELDKLGSYLITNHLRSEVLAAIRARTFVPRSEFDKDVNIMNLANGLYNLETGTFAEHISNYLSITQLPVEYKQDAKCPMFSKFLRETIEPEQIAIVVKMLGYILLRKTIYHKAFMLTGEGNNGKSTLIDVIKTLLGEENIASRSLQDISDDRFAKADLYCKFANLFADIPDAKIQSGGDFKMLVSGDILTAQRKFGQPFKFKNFAKLIFSANKIPRSRDDGYAYMRRWVIIPFNKIFEGEDADENLLEKLTTKEELSGIFNLALKGLQKLRTDRGFREADIEEIRQQYELGASKIKTFTDEKCILDINNKELSIPSAELREAFAKYCRENGTTHYNMKTFGEALKKLGVDHKQKQINKKKIFHYIGIDLKERKEKQRETTSMINFLGSSPIIKGVEKKDDSRDIIIDSLPKNLIIQTDSNDNIKNESVDTGKGIVNVIYCPNNCNRAFATQQQVDEHLKECQAAHKG